MIKSEDLKRYAKGVVLIFLLTCPILLSAKVYFVDTTGNDSNTGTSINTPYKTLTQANTLAVAGDTIYIRGGIHSYLTTIKLSKVGSAGNLIKIFSYPGDERPVLDFSGMAIGSNNRGVTLPGSYYYIKGIRIKGAGDNGMNISGAYNLIEYCDFFENRDGGCQLGGGAHDNKIINCDSYLNADYVAGSGSYTGGNADGFSPKLDCGTGNYFYGCRAWQNSDDGWDGYLSSNSDITTTIENCWTWGNGYLKDGVTTNSSMNGNGFKMGGGGSSGNWYQHNNILTNCLSFNNKAKGFDQNNNIGSMTLIHCTGKSNGANNFAITSPLGTGKVLTVKNCISFEKSKVALLSNAIVATNSWDSKFTVSATDFESIDTLGITAPRKADGSLPDISFMHLASSSPLLDAGTDLGLPFVGNNPDLGCFERGLSAKYHKLTTEVAEGNGSITPNGTNTYDSASSVSVKATAGTGYYFSKWTNTNGEFVSKSNPYIVAMNSGNITLKAHFLIAPKYTLTTSVLGGGYILPVSGSKLDSSSTVILTATPNANYSFVSWGGDASGTSKTTSLLIDGNKTVSATFTLVKHKLTLNIIPVNGGTVSPSDTIYEYGSMVDLTASANAHYKFVGWSGAVTDNTATVSLTMNGDKTLTANFELQKFNLTVNLQTAGSGTVNPTNGTYSFGTKDTIIATPASGYEFVNWTDAIGNSIGNNDSLIYTIESNSTITANFKKLTSAIENNTTDAISAYVDCLNFLHIKIRAGKANNANIALYNITGYKIMDINPKLMFNNSSNEIVVNTNTLYKGVYFCKLHLDGKTITRKILINK